MKAILRKSAIAIAGPFALAIAIAAAEARCTVGYIQRNAVKGDEVCVTPEDQDEAQKQNANAANNRRLGGGAYGPNTCRDGYVWREAYQGDVVCVTPYERAKAKRQNAQSPRYTVK